MSLDDPNLVSFKTAFGERWIWLDGRFFNHQFWGFPNFCEVSLAKAPHFVTVPCVSHTKPATLCCLIKDYHIRTINIMVQAATFFMLGIAIMCRSTDSQLWWKKATPHNSEHFLAQILMFEPAFGYLLIPMLQCQVVVVFVAFSVVTLDGSIFGVTHMPAAPKFKLFLRTSLRTSSNFLRNCFELASNKVWTKFEEVRRKSWNVLFEELRTFSNRAKKKNFL